MALGTGLGLVHNVGKIYIRRTLVNSVIGIIIPAITDYQPFNEVIKKINSKLVEVENMTLLKSDPYKSDCTPILTSIIEDLNSIEKVLLDLSTYIDNTTEIPKTYNCQLKMSPILTSDLTEIETKVKNFVTAMDTSLTVTKITATPSLYNTFLDNLLLMESYMRDEMSVFLDRLEVMDGLSNGYISQRLPFILQTLECFKTGELQHMTVNYCDKSKVGLHCELTLNVHKIINEYYHYVPVSYDNVQFRAEHIGQRLVKNMEDNWELIDCENDEDESENFDSSEDLDEILQCQVKPYSNECSKVIETTHYDQILKHCNFTFKSEVTPIKRTVTGILLQGDEILVKELDNSDKLVKSVLPNKFPLHLITENHVSVTLHDREIILKPYFFLGRSILNIL
jgi:hypothetical protein